MVFPGPLAVQKQGTSQAEWLRKAMPCSFFSGTQAPRWGAEQCEAKLSGGDVAASSDSFLLLVSWEVPRVFLTPSSVGPMWARAATPRTAECLAHTHFSVVLSETSPALVVSQPVTAFF